MPSIVIVGAGLAGLSRVVEDGLPRVAGARGLAEVRGGAGALLALFCTGCATSGNHQWIKPICSAVPFEPSEVLEIGRASCRERV